MVPVGLFFLVFIFILLVITLFILFLVLALYLIPIDITGTAVKEEEVFTTSITVLWGAFGFSAQHERTTIISFILFDHPLVTRHLKDKTVNIPDAGAEGHPPDMGAIICLVIHLWPDIRTLFEELGRSLVLRRFDCEIVYGTSDAALTGRIFGYCSALLPAQFLAEQIFVDITPVFGRNCLNVRLSVSLQIQRFLLVLISALKIMMDRETRRVLGDFRRGGRGYA